MPFSRRAYRSKTTSPGLSSIRRISGGPSLSLISTLQYRQRKQKIRPDPDLRFHPKPSAIAPDDFQTERETQTGARPIGSVKALEWNEDFGEMLLFDSNSIIGHREYPFQTVAVRGDTDLRRRAIAAVFDRISDQILEQQSHRIFLRPDD